MDTAYCKRWVFSQRRAIGQLDAAAARLRHDCGEPYTAIVASERSPCCIVDIAGEWVSVSFMDDRNRSYLEYDFRRTGLDKVFLTRSIFREYHNETDTVIKAKTFVFKETGETLVECRDLVNNAVEERKFIGSVGENWDQYPAFGDYAPLCRAERRIAR